VRLSPAVPCYGIGIARHHALAILPVGAVPSLRASSVSRLTAGMVATVSRANPCSVRSCPSDLSAGVLLVAPTGNNGRTESRQRLATTHDQCCRVVGFCFVGRGNRLGVLPLSLSAMSQHPIRRVVWRSTKRPNFFLRFSGRLQDPAFICSRGHDPTLETPDRDRSSIDS